MSAEKKPMPLPKDEIAKYKAALLEKLREIKGDVTQMEGQALASSGDEVSVDHMADHGSDSFEKDQTIGLIERESKALKEIHAALKRIEDGTFGVCESCEVKIKKPRLKAIPSARLCLECQIKEEEG